VHRPPEERCPDGKGDEVNQADAARGGADWPPHQAFGRHRQAQRGDPDQQAIQMANALTLLAEDLLVDLLQRARHRQRSGGYEQQAGGGRDGQRGGRGGEQVGHDPRCPSIEAKAQGNVVVHPRAGERGQQDQQRKQGDQQARAEQHDLIGKVEGLQPDDGTLR
jgi:hypothetical protein